jgi:hypothetical protein
LLKEANEEEEKKAKTKKIFAFGGQNSSFA